MVQIKTILATLKEQHPHKQTENDLQLPEAYIITSKLEAEVPQSPFRCFIITSMCYIRSGVHKSLRLIRFPRSSCGARLSDDEYLQEEIWGFYMIAHCSSLKQEASSYSPDSEQSQQAKTQKSKCVTVGKMLQQRRSFLIKMKANKKSQKQQGS